MPTPSKPAMPSGPLLRPPANFSQWETIFSYPDEQKKKDKTTHKTKLSPEAAAMRPRKIVTTKTGRVVHEESTDLLRRTTDMWFDSGSQYVKSAGDAKWFRLDRPSSTGGTADTRYHPMPANGYRNAEMIKEENYAGTAPYDHRPCLIFIPGGGDKNLDFTKADEVQKKLKAVDSVAYVDADSRQPVELRTPDETCTFQFDPPPNEMQTLPADLVAQIKDSEDARARLNQVAPRPY